MTAGALLARQPNGSPTSADLDVHPIVVLIRDSIRHGHDGIPTSAELAALHVDHSTRRRVEDTCDRVVELRDRGLYSEAWALGAQETAQILANLPDHQRAPTYLAAPVALPSFPDELPSAEGAAMSCRVETASLPGGLGLRRAVDDGAIT